MQNINGSDVFKKIVQQQTINPPQYDNHQVKNDFERSPIKDSFKLSGNLQEDAPKIVAAASFLAATAVTLGALVKGKRANKLIDAAKDELLNKENLIAQHAATIAAQGQEIASKTSAIQRFEALTQKQQDEIKKLNETLSDLIQVPENLKKAAEDSAEELRVKMVLASLDYDPMTPPITVEPYKMPSWCRKIFKLGDIKPLEPQGTISSGAVDVQILKDKLKADGFVDFALSPSTKIKAVISDDAFIGSNVVKNLGETVDTEITMKYGRRVNWSEEKIARDIMQNFYDGHGNTLDGVRLMVENTPSGTTKIKVIGKGLFSHENLQYIGSGTKEENPFNAGGFGEGAKILVANLIGKGDTSNVRFRCADWQLDFSAGEKALRRTLNKVNSTLDGNSVEFETTNSKLVESIIDSLNWFQHSKNPDFQGLTYDSQSFAFKFMPKQKGNIYLTQRFEFERPGNWQESLSDMSLIFKRKPDPEEFEEMIGAAMPKDRDRTQLGHDDIVNLTRYFARKEMSDDELLQTLVSTRPMWGELVYEKEKTPLMSFITGLLKEASRRRIGLDVQDAKYACYTNGCNDVVQKELKKYGYKLIPDEFSKVHIPSGIDIFQTLSAHKPIQPDAVEIKKLKLLEEAVDAITDDFENALRKHLQNPQVEFVNGKGTLDTYTMSRILPMLNEDKEIIDVMTDGAKGSMPSVYDLSDDKLEKLSKVVMVKIAEKLKEISKNPYSEKSKNFIAAIDYLKSHPDIDAKSKDYLISLKNFYLIGKDDVKKPRFIFDRKNELCSETLGEAMIESGKYLGHWVDREYLNTANFNQIFATWLHEICHKIGGDGSSEFTYALTDLIRVLLAKDSNAASKIRLAAIESVFNSI